MPYVAQASAPSASTANLGFEATGMHDSAMPPREATPQSLSKAKHNMVALPGLLFTSTQTLGCLCFSGKNNTPDSANNARLFDGETELSLVT